MRSRGEEELSVLMTEYGQAREDERSASVQITALLSVALALVVVLAALTAHTCVIGHGCGGHLTPVPIATYLIAPLLPAILVAYVTVLAGASVIRSYYERKLELLIQNRTEMVEVPMWAHISQRLVGQSRAIGVVKALWVVILGGTLAVLFAGLGYIAFEKVPPGRLQILALGLDVAFLAPSIVYAVVTMMEGSALWRRLVDGLPTLRERTAAGFPARHHATKRRTLASYLLIPRPEELLVKTWFIPIAYFVLPLMNERYPSGAAVRVGTMIGFLIVFELLIYQARYIVNDVRDRKDGLESRRFWFAGQKENDEEFERAALRMAFVDVAARLALAGLLVGCLFPIGHGEGPWYAGLLLGVFMAAIPYEWARSRIRQRGVLQVAHSNTRVTADELRWSAVMTSLAGVGYGLRVVAGYWLAGESNPVALFLAGVAGLALGSLIISLTWALECTKSSLTLDKPHLVAFRKTIEAMQLSPSGASSASSNSLSPSSRVAFGRQALAAQWSVAEIAAVVSACALVMYRVSGSVGALPLVVAAMLVLCAGISIAKVPVGLSPSTSTSGSVPVIGLIGTAIVGLGIGLLVAQSGASTRTAVGAAVTVSMPFLLQTVFRSMNYLELSTFSFRVASVLKAIARAPYAAFVRTRPGPATDV